MTEIEFENLMEAKNLSEPDREEMRALRDLLSLRVEWRATRTDEAWKRFLEASEARRVEPATDSHENRVMKSAARMAEVHREALKKLADEDKQAKEPRCESLSK